MSSTKTNEHASMRTSILILMLLLPALAQKPPPSFQGLLGTATYNTSMLKPTPARSIISKTVKRTGHQHAPEVSENPTVTDSVVKAEVTDVPFNGFLKYKTYSVGVTQDGDIRNYTGGFVHGPGHHISAIAAFAFDKQMKPHAILKTGDTRLARAERDKPYVQDGFIAGRMDKKGAESSKIALAELAEEVGGEVVPGTFLPLGSEVNPTMPSESTESDAYFMAAVNISGNPYGDGGEMELTDLIGPKVSTPMEAIASMDAGELSESSRTRTMYGRGFDAIGYVPQLDAYVSDHPELAKKFDTLGLGEVVDIRKNLKGGKLPEARPKGDNLEARVNDVVTTTREEVALDNDTRMINAKTKHAVNENGVITTLDKEFPNQYLQLDYDRAKVGKFYVDPKQGPMIQMKTQAKPALAFAPESPNVLRKDVADVKISRDQDISEQLPEGTRVLGAPSGASAGQTDLYYHFVVDEVKAPKDPKAEGFVSLGEAVKLCRTGHGDTQTEALCERLADDLGWIPNLGMSVEDARKLMD